jgi:hypothetical protein
MKSIACVLAGCLADAALAFFEIKAAVVDIGDERIACAK